MSELTLESLAKRVEELERRFGVLPPGAIPLKPPYYAMPGKGDIVAALEAVANLKDYDVNVLKDQDAIDIAEEKRIQEQRNDSDRR